MPMPMKIDLHIHSNYSKDSASEPKAILDYAKKIGLGGVGVVDHGTLKGGLAALKANEAEDFLVIPGAEIKTDRGEVIGYFLQEEIRSNHFADVIDEMRDQDAFISLPHPYDGFRRNRIDDPEEAGKWVDAIEVYNSRCILESSNKKALKLVRKLGRAVTAGSDGHHIEEIGSAGIIIEGDDPQSEIRKNREYYGEKNPIMVHARSTLQKLFPKRG